MNDRANNTKIERVVEAMEDFANAIIDARATSTNASIAEIKAVTDDRNTARFVLTGTLREFLQPQFRVIEGGLGRQGYSPDWTEAEKPECGLCHRHHKCADDNCAHWHQAVQVCVNKVPPPKIGARVKKINGDGPEAA